MLLCALAELRPLVRSQAGAQRIHFIGDDDLNPWIVSSWARLYNIFVDGGDPYFEKEKDLEVTSGVTTKVPSDFMQLRAVVPVIGGTAYDELPDLDVHEVQASTSDVGLGCARGYRLRAQELQLPGAIAGQTYRLVYVPAPAEPKDAAGVYQDTQPMDCVSISGRDWVVLASAIRCLQKQKENTAALETALVAVRRELGVKASRRTTTRLKRVAEVVSFDDPYLTGGGRARR